VQHKQFFIYDALKLTASPLEPSSTKVTSLDDLVKLLKRLNMVYEKRDYYNVVYILLKSFDEEFDDPIAAAMMAEQFSRMVMDASLLPDILRWVGKSNHIDNNNSVYRNKKTPGIGAKHNNLVWVIRCQADGFFCFWGTCRWSYFLLNTVTLLPSILKCTLLVRSSTRSTSLMFLDRDILK